MELLQNRNENQINDIRVAFNNQFHQNMDQAIFVFIPNNRVEQFQNLLHINNNNNHNE